VLGSKAFQIWRRLANRFDLEDQPPSGLGANVSTLVQPITNVDALLTVSLTGTNDTAALGGGVQIVITVPAGKRWKIYMYQLTRLTGDRNLDAVWVYDGTNNVFIETFTAASTRNSGVLNTPIPLDEGQSLQVDVTGGTTDSSYRCRLWVDQEDAY
jgi:hypothetical protein